MNTAFAMLVGSTRLGFYLEQGTVLIRRDGQPFTPAEGDTALTAGATLTRITGLYWGDSYTMTWADGTRAWIDRVGTFGLHLTVDAAAARKATLSGLLGTFDGDQAMTSLRRAALALPLPARFEQLYPSFADGWRITDATSLFDYPAGQSTASFTDRGFPERPAIAADLPAAGRDAARTACARLGVTEPATLEACTLDLALTGQAMFAVGAADVQATLPSLGNAGETTSLSVAAGAAAAVTFAGTAGQRAFIRVESTLPDQCGVLSLKGPQGTTLGTGCLAAGRGWIDPAPLPTTGAYTVVVDPAGDAAGTATVTVFATVDQTAAVVPDGPEVNLTVAAPGAVARATFAATAGDKVFVDVTSSTVPNQCGVPTLAGTDGATLAIGCVNAGKGSVDGVILPKTGVYAIVVNPTDEGTGDVRLRVIMVHDQDGAITIGGPEVTATVAQPGGVARLMFAGTAGQKVFVDVTGYTVPGQCGVPSLLGPDGGTVALGCVIGGTGFIDGIVLPRTGQYAVAVNPAGYGTGEVRMRAIAVSDQHATMTINGPAVTATLPQPGAVARLTFAGTAGQKVTIEVISSTLPHQCGTPRLLGPDTSAVSMGCIAAASSSFTATLPVTGQYTVVVDPADRGVGETQLRVHT